jgi:acetyltransferase-like isoleucine patch superfamily enzyme
LPDPLSHTRKALGDPLNIAPRVLTRLYSLWVEATYPFASVGRNLSIHYTTQIDRRTASRIKLGRSLIIRKDVWLVVIQGPEHGHKITIDDDCVINNQVTISAKNHIHIEHGVMLSRSVLIMDHNHAYEDPTVPIREQGVTEGGTIRIEQGCWVGQGAAIVCGQGSLVIGRNSVVAANALVTRSFPPYSVIVGNPARLARQFDMVKGVWVGGGAMSVRPAVETPIARTAPQSSAEKQSLAQ